MRSKIILFSLLFSKRNADGGRDGLTSIFAFDFGNLEEELSGGRGEAFDPMGLNADTRGVRLEDFFCNILNFPEVGVFLDSVLLRLVLIPINVALRSSFCQTSSCSVSFFLFLFDLF